MTVEVSTAVQFALGSVLKREREQIQPAQLGSAAHPSSVHLWSGEGAQHLSPRTLSPSPSSVVVNHRLALRCHGLGR